MPNPTSHALLKDSHQVLGRPAVATSANASRAMSVRMASEFGAIVAARYVAPPTGVIQTVSSAGNPTGCDVSGNSGGSGRGTPWAPAGTVRISQKARGAPTPEASVANFAASSTSSLRAAAISATSSSVGSGRA